MVKIIPQEVTIKKSQLMLMQECINSEYEKKKTHSYTRGAKMWNCLPEGTKSKKAWIHLKKTLIKKLTCHDDLHIAIFNGVMYLLASA